MKATPHGMQRSERLERGVPYSRSSHWLDPLKESHVGKAKNQPLSEELTPAEPKEFLSIARPSVEGAQ